MKIISVDIAAFGKLRDYHLAPEDGVTLIYGPNEEGKTTLMAFIKMMFYGTAGKKQAEAKNPRKRYLPWGGGAMAGSITFEQAGRRYRIDREFGARDSADKITLWDLDLGTKEALQGTTSLGERFFGLSEAAAEKSIFVTDSIPTRGSADADGELNTRLAGIVETGDEDTSYEEVAARLKKAKEALLSKSGRIGSLDKARSRLGEIEGELADCEATEAHLRELYTHKAEASAALEESSKAGARLFDDLKRLDKIKKKGFVKQFVEGYTALEEIEGRLTLTDGTTADEEWLRRGYSLIAEAEAAASLARQAEELADSADTPDNTAIGPDPAELERRISQIDEELTAAPAKGSLLKPLLIIFGLLFIAAAVVLYLSDYQIFGTASAGLGIILALIRSFIRGSKKGMAKDALLTEKQRLLEEYAAEKQRILKAEQAAADFKEKQAAAKAAEDNARRLCLMMTEYFQPLSPVCDCAEARQLADRVSRDIADLAGWRKQLEVAARHSGCEDIEAAKARLAALEAEGVPDADISEGESLSDMVKDRSKKTSELKSQLTALQLQIKAAEKAAGRAELLRREQEELSEQIKKGEAFCRLADTALEALEEAYRRFRRDYSGALDSRTAQILSGLTGGRYTGVTISKNFEINVSSSEAFGLHEAEVLSRGTADQVYLALRLAMAELMGGKEGLPLILDDPLDRYDDIRAEKALEFLKAYGSERQVILFTCHSYFADIAKALDIKIKDFKENLL
ncbi:MAG: AAA family ATPase [Clostridia bacterium]|nr:AAA family ATPase [Clostridia bacterium]